MILVTLGTQDKDFSRLLKAVDKQIEKGFITDKVIVQAGSTKYESKNMEIFDLISPYKLKKLINEADLIITHGGVGSILSAIKKGKKVIAASRLSKYGEHHNDHQRQIVREFAKRGYILELRDFNKFDKILEKSKKFNPKKFKSNNHNIIKLLDNYIEEDNHTSWFNKIRQKFLYLLFGFISMVVNVVSFYLFNKMGLGLYISNTLAWILAIIIAFLTNKFYVFNKLSLSKKDIIKESCLFLTFRVISLGIDMAFMYLFIYTLLLNNILSKIIVNIIVVILNYIFSKFIIFKDK